MPDKRSKASISRVRRNLADGAGIESDDVAALLAAHDVALGEADAAKRDAVALWDCMGRVDAYRKTVSRSNLPHNYYLLECKEWE